MIMYATNNSNLTRYLLFLFLCFSPIKAQHFILITSLYNETHTERRQEYITCLERNLQHPAIEHIHVVYDTSNDGAHNELLEYLKQQPVSISYINDRPTFGYCFELASEQYPNRGILLSNADIFFNKTLFLLENYDLTNKFLALTRWDVKEDGRLEIFKQYDKNGEFDPISYLSQDVWIFMTPLKKFINPNFQLGTWACDGYIACQAYLSDLHVINPCLSIQCCHLHLSKIRHWIPQSIPGAKALLLPWCTL